MSTVGVTKLKRHVLIDGVAVELPTGVRLVAGAFLVKHRNNAPMTFTVKQYGSLMNALCAACEKLIHDLSESDIAPGAQRRATPKKRHETGYPGISLTKRRRTTDTLWQLHVRLYTVDGSVCKESHDVCISDEVDHDLYNELLQELIVKHKESMRQENVRVSNVAQGTIDTLTYLKSQRR